MAEQKQQQNQTRDNTPVLTKFFLPPVEELPNPIPADKLMSKEFLKTVEDVASEIVRTNNLKDAHKLLSRLESVNMLKDDPQYAQLYRQYERTIISLKLLTLAGRNKKDIKELFSKHLLYALRSSVGLMDKIETLLSIYPDTFDNESIKNVIVNAMFNNNEHIGEEPLKIENQVTAQPPQIKNWLLDYENMLRKPATQGSPQGYYFNTSGNVRILKTKEKQALQKIINLFTRLKYPQLFGDFVNIKDIQKMATPQSQPEVPPPVPETEQQIPTFQEPEPQPPPAQQQEAPRNDDLASVEKRLQEGQRAPREEKRVAESDKPQSQDPYREPIE